MRLLLLVLLMFVSLGADARQPEETKKFHKELSKFYDLENIKTNKIEDLSAKNDIVYNVFDDERKIGLVVLTSAMGRHDWFDYLIIYNLELEIQLVKVLVYRSDYGSEITAKRWLSQFAKKKDSLKYGSDIQAISGATFSAMALTKNVNRINKKLHEYFAE